MKKIYLIISVVLCILMGTAYAEQATRDEGSLNYVKSPGTLTSTVHHYDYRNNAFAMPPLPDWVGTSKGEYYLFQALIKTGDSLTDFDDIMEVKVKSSDEPQVEFTLLKYPCAKIMGLDLQLYYLNIRYYTWLRTVTWTYTMRYRDNDGYVHIQSYERQGATTYTDVTSPITGALFVQLGERLYMQWNANPVPGSPLYAQSFVLVFDESGCVTHQLSTSPNPTSVSFDVTPHIGKVVRAENRLILPGYGMIARSAYYTRVPGP